MLRETGKQHNRSFSQQCLVEDVRSVSLIAGEMYLQLLGTEIKPFELCVADPKCVRHWGVSADRGSRGPLLPEALLVCGECSCTVTLRWQTRQGIESIMISMPTSLPRRPSLLASVWWYCEAAAPTFLCCSEAPEFRQSDSLWPAPERLIHKWECQCYRLKMWANDGDAWVSIEPFSRVRVSSHKKILLGHILYFT